MGNAVAQGDWHGDHRAKRDPDPDRRSGQVDQGLERLGRRGIQPLVQGLDDPDKDTGGFCLLSILGTAAPQDHTPCRAKPVDQPVPRPPTRALQRRQHLEQLGRDELQSRPVSQSKQRRPAQIGLQ